jgi:hypothetical protein
VDRCAHCAWHQRERAGGGLDRGCGHRPGQRNPWIGAEDPHLPLTLLTLGLFWFVINALMLEVASSLVNGFQVRGFEAAFLGAIVLSAVSSLLQWLIMPRRRTD